MNELGSARKMTKSRQAFIFLRDQILGGQLAPGAHLTLRPIAESLDLSVGSVSEAMREHCERSMRLQLRDEFGV